MLRARSIQHFDAFGVALGTVALTGCRASLPDRSGTGEYGYRGQEGYRTHLTDPDAAYNQAPPQRSTGLMLLGARDYDPSLGRFVEADPLAVDPGAAMMGQANRWVYCANDPVNLSDPSGHTFGMELLLGLLTGWIVGIVAGFFGISLGLAGKSLKNVLVALLASIMTSHCTIAFAARVKDLGPNFLNFVMFLRGILAPALRDWGELFPSNAVPLRVGAARWGGIAAALAAGFVAGNWFHDSVEGGFL